MLGELGMQPMEPRYSKKNYESTLEHCLHDQAKPRGLVCDTNKSVVA